MRASATLLRFVIAVSLMLNGIGTAFASAQMLQGEGGRMDHAAETSMPPCHEDQAPAEDALDGQAQVPQSECCQPGSCTCPCASHTSVALVGKESATNHIAHAASAHAMTLGHAAPALPHLIRPPIG